MGLSCREAVALLQNVGVIRSERTSITKVILFNTKVNNKFLYNKNIFLFFLKINIFNLNFFWKDENYTQP